MTDSGAAQDPDNQSGHDTTGSEPGPSPDSTWGQGPTFPPAGSQPGAPVTWSDAVSQPTQPPGAPLGSMAYPRRGFAGPAATVSIIGLVCCAPLGPVGLIMGLIETRAIDSGQTDPAKRGSARTAIILGAVSTGLYLFLAIVVVAFIIARAAI